MRIVNKKLIKKELTVFEPIKAVTNLPFEIRGRFEIPEPPSEVVPFIDFVTEIPPDPEPEIGPQGPPGKGKYFYGPDEPDQEDIGEELEFELGDKWFNTATNTEFTYLPTDETFEEFFWTETQAPSTTQDFWTNQEPTKATNLEGIPENTVLPIGSSPTEILERLLYPTFLSFSSFNIGIPKFPTGSSDNYEIGQTANSGSYTAQWSINDADKAVYDSLSIRVGPSFLLTDFPITSSNIGGVAIEPFSNEVSIEHNSYRLTNNEGSVIFTVSLSGNDGNSVSRTDFLRWNFPLFYGKNAGDTIQANDIIPAFTRIKNRTISQMKLGLNFSIPAEEEGAPDTFLYWVSPRLVVSGGNANLDYNPNTSFTNIINPNTPTGVPMLRLNDINLSINGLTITYRVFRTTVPFGGAITLRAVGTSGT
jgi:hypothetical protein